MDVCFYDPPSSTGSLFIYKPEDIGSFFRFFAPFFLRSFIIKFENCSRLDRGKTNKESLVKKKLGSLKKNLIMGQ